jgi:hypothetical protein
MAGRVTGDESSAAVLAVDTSAEKHHPNPQRATADRTPLVETDVVFDGMVHDRGILGGSLEIDGIGKSVILES